MPQPTNLMNGWCAVCMACSMDDIKCVFGIYLQADFFISVFKFVQIIQFIQNSGFQIQMISNSQWGACQNLIWEINRIATICVYFVSRDVSAYSRRRRLLSRVQLVCFLTRWKENTGIDTLKGCVLQRVSLSINALSEVKVVLGMRQSINSRPQFL